MEGELVKMKKILSLLLALCMLPAAIPAAAEEDVSGTWYIIMMNLTVGTMELNADGTCSLSVSNAGEEMSAEGTWTQEGEKLSVHVNDNTLPLTFGGDQLLFDAEGIAALVGSSSLGAPGMDLSVLSGLIQISREPGFITAAEFSAYQENGTLPEGKTEEEMQTFQAEMMSAVMLLMGSMNADGSGSGAADEAPAPDLTILEDNFYVRDSYDGQEGIYIAKVQNNNDVPAYLSGGTMTLRDAEGNEVGMADYLRSTGSCYLEPGEITFLSITADVNEGASVDSYDVDLQSSSISYQAPDTALEVSAAELRVEEEYDTSYYAAATVTNTTENTLAHIYAIIAVRDEEGKLLDLANAGLYQNELPAGSTVILVESLDSRAGDYCTKNGLTPSQVEAYAWIASY